MPPSSLLRRGAAFAAVAALASAALAASLPFDFIQFGNFTRMVESGDTGGHVRLADLPQRKGTWGVGATAGLKGEIVQIDGQLLVSQGSDPQGRAQALREGQEAALFAGAQVQSWVDVPVPRDMHRPQFEAFVREQASGRGLSLELPFVFRVEGGFPHLIWHVVTGEAGGNAAGHAHGAMASGHHANQASGMRVFHAPGATGQLVGIYSGAGLEGVVSHAGERFHVHYADTAATVSGHVDGYAVAAGAVLKLPVR